MKLDRAMLDISPDDAVDMNNKKRILRWDAKKRKFVKVSPPHPACGVTLHLNPTLY